MIATRIPATAGPIMRALLNMEEFNAMAFIRSALPTISTMNDCRAGMSKAFTRPRRTDSITMCQAAIVPVKVSQARTSASIMEAVWVVMTIR